MTAAEIIGFILGSNVIIALIAGWFARRKNAADATETLTKAATGLVNELQEQIQLQDKKHSESEKQLRAEIARLAKEFKECKEDLEGQISEVAALTRAFSKLQQEFLEVNRAKELLQAAVTDRDHRISSMERDLGVARSRITELESQLAILKDKINGQSS